MWIETENGYVKAESIIEVHKRYFSDWRIMFILSSGDSCIYKHFDKDATEEMVDIELTKIVTALGNEFIFV